MLAHLLGTNRHDDGNPALWGEHDGVPRSLRDAQQSVRERRPKHLVVATVFRGGADVDGPRREVQRDAPLAIGLIEGPWIDVSVFDSDHDGMHGRRLTSYARHDRGELGIAALVRELHAGTRNDNVAVETRFRDPADGEKLMKARSRQAEK